ncbi:MAG: hypothetical protein AAB425_10430 [Bdellovibrionota bacterium]
MSAHVNIFNLKKRVGVGLIALVASQVSVLSCTPSDTTVSNGRPVVRVIHTVPGKNEFTPNLLTENRGAKVKVSFANLDQNPDSLHNWVLASIGAGVDVANAGALAGVARSFVPESRQVLAHSRLLKPGESETFEIQIPDVPGDYPFLCTVPGHAESTRGILRVK